ncbi:GIY-YIG nuclease family protein [Streptomyces sp. NPDC048508]|uniref:GIY-YIG nuclease family protein n=1 Tax=Streptomyces sp. NPDC048508 TaxID=3365561 RepID=UPI00371171A6
MSTSTFEHMRNSADWIRKVATAKTSVPCAHQSAHLGGFVDHAVLTEPDQLWSAQEVLSRLCPVPAAAGVYGWHFEQAPNADLPAGLLLYVGIAPRYMANRTSTQTLRKRVRYHYRGNAAGSTLRLTLGCLLGIELRRVGRSGTRMTFGKAGEAALSQWMAENARVCWIEHDEPWTLESELISQLDLPLNLDQNRHNPFHSRLKELRSQARKRARELAVSA